MRLFLLALALLFAPLRGSAQTTPPDAPPVAVPAPTPAPPDTLLRDGDTRSPALAGILSILVFPGAGHLYAGEFEPAGVIAGVMLGGFYAATKYGVERNHCSGGYCRLNTTFGLGLGVALGAAIYAHIDAPRAAGRFNRRHAPRPATVSLAPALFATPGARPLGLTLRVRP